MSSFFRPPPPEPDEEWEELPTGPWEGPPENVVGGASALQVVVARSDDAVVLVTEVEAYPTGFSFELTLRWRGALLERLTGGPMQHLVEPIYLPSGELAPEFLRFGVRFSDGSKASNVAIAPPPGGPDEPPEGPTLEWRGGGSSRGVWNETAWVWPLPPPGSLTFVCEWPAAGIEETLHEVGAGAILEAAAHAEQLWGDEPSGHGRAAGSTYFRTRRRKRRET